MIKKVFCSLLAFLMLFSVGCNGYQTYESVDESVSESLQESEFESIAEPPKLDLNVGEDIPLPEEGGDLNDYVEYGKAVLNAYIKLELPHSIDFVNREIKRGKNKLYFAEDKQEVMRIIEETKTIIESYVFPQSELSNMLKNVVQKFPNGEPELEHYFGWVNGEYFVALVPNRRTDGIYAYSFADFVFYAGGYYFSDYVGEMGVWNGTRYKSLRNAFSDGDVSLAQIEAIYDDYMFLYDGMDYLSYVSLEVDNVDTLTEDQNLLIQVGVRGNQKVYTKEELNINESLQEENSVWFELALMDLEDHLGKDKNYEIGYVTDKGSGVLRRTNSLGKGVVTYKPDKTFSKITFCGCRKYYLPIEAFEGVGWIQFYVTEIGDLSAIVYSPKIYYNVEKDSENPDYSNVCFSIIQSI